ncbi:Flp pilus assembly protein CpaB [Acidobacteria bacterium AB60]|nr:Flp pilus assembly protein CpaB [Acidobacteria bacterium AB60]
MNRKLLTVLFCAFLVAAGCSFLVYRIVGKSVAVAHKSATTRVVGAAADLKLGTILTAANLATVDIAGPLPKGAILKPEDVVGRGVVADLYQGEPILESRLAPKGSGGGLAATIKQGMRACAVKVDEVVGVAGFVTPGMRVDVLISGDPPGPPDPKEGTKVKTLLQNVEVLSAGTDIEKDAEGKPKQVHVVNLLVSPEDAEVLSLAVNHTQIQLVLRNPLDTNVSSVPGSAMANLFAGPEAPVKGNGKLGRLPRKAAVNTISVEVLHGTQRFIQKFVLPEASE